MTKFKTGIIGAAGYTGGELIRLLIHHPHCELVYIHSNSQKGKKLAEVHPDLLGESDFKNKKLNLKKPSHSNMSFRRI